MEVPEQVAAHEKQTRVSEGQELARLLPRPLEREIQRYADDHGKLFDLDA